MTDLTRRHLFPALAAFTLVPASAQAVPNTRVVCLDHHSPPVLVAREDFGKNLNTPDDPPSQHFLMNEIVPSMESFGATHAIVSVKEDGRVIFEYADSLGKYVVHPFYPSPRSTWIDQVPKAWTLTAGLSPPNGGIWMYV